MIRCLAAPLIAASFCNHGVAQTKIVRGIVMDSISRSPLQNVSIRIFNTHRGTITNSEGRFRITVDEDTRQLEITATGYHASSIFLSDSSVKEYRVFLSRSYKELADVIVSSKPRKYRNKNNPAVDLIRKVIANKSRNGPGADPHLSYDEYEKIRVLFDKPPKFIYDNFIMKKMRFVFENVDSLLVPGKKLTPVYSQEVFSKNFFQHEPEKKKKIVTGQKSTNYGEYFDMKAISATANRLYEDINIYDNSISAFTMQFTSPIANSGPTFYMYFLGDTIEEEDEKLVQLYFTPRNPEDLLLQGRLYITLDGNYAVRKAELEVNKHINLNYIRSFKVNQDFEKGVGDRYHLHTSDMIAFFSPFPHTPGIFGERSVTIQNITDTIIPEFVFRGPQVDSIQNVSNRPDSFWVVQRPVPLTAVEVKTYSNVDSLVKMKPYNRLADFLIFFTAGYKSVGKFEIGPVGNFYSFNSVEGSRVQFGGRTKPALSTRYYGDGYIAYGFGDQRWKYFLSGTYSLNNRSIYLFPFEFIQASYLHDTRNLGVEDIFAQGNSFLSSFNRGINSAWLYNDIVRVNYVREFENHLSYNLGMKYWLQEPAGSLSYVYETTPNKYDTVANIATSELAITLRWAPHEQFYQGKLIRRDIANKYPIMTFQYAKGIKGLFGGQYNYDALRFSIYKRFYLNPIGFTDARFSAGYVGGSLPYPLLVIHPANQSYFYSENSYNQMRVGEFISDHYFGFSFDHFFNGFFFNKIPLIKKLRIREVVEAKLLYGGLRDENNPAINPQQMKFPLFNGTESSYVLNGKPYFEAGVGVYNIFSILRIDLVWRFSYLDHPDVHNLGLLFSTNFNF